MIVAANSSIFELSTGAKRAAVGLAGKLARAGGALIGLESHGTDVWKHTLHGFAGASDDDSFGATHIYELLELENRLVTSRQLARLTITGPDEVELISIHIPSQSHLNGGVQRRADDEVISRGLVWLGAHHEDPPSGPQLAYLSDLDKRPFEAEASNSALQAAMEHAKTVLPPGAGLRL